MAISGYEEAVLPISLNANVDFSTDTGVTGTYRFVVVVNDGGEGKFDLAGANARAIGVLLDAPKQNSPGRIGVGGIVPIELGGTVTAGGELSAAADGLAVAQSSTNPSIAVALSSGVLGDIIPGLLLPQR